MGENIHPNTNLKSEFSYIRSCLGSSIYGMVYMLTFL